MVNEAPRDLISVGQSRSTVGHIVTHLWSVNDRFVPPLSTYVDIAAYAEKLVAYAERFEAWSEGRLEGLCAVYMNSPVMYVSSVSTVPGARVGLPSELLGRAWEVARERGCTSIELRVHRGNQRSRNFFERAFADFGLSVHVKQLPTGATEAEDVWESWRAVPPDGYPPRA